MQNIRQLYRANYAGENVITKLHMTDGEWIPELEFVPNQVTNTFTTRQALIFGDGESHKEFDLRFIRDHKGGEFGTNRLQTYGVDNTYEYYTPDFLVADDDLTVDQLANSDYTDEHIVYANAMYILRYPGKFYLIPQSLGLDPNALATYMACFDGHKKIFLMGFDEYTHSKLNSHNQFYVNSLKAVMDTYQDVDFVRVQKYNTHSTNELLQGTSNFRQISFREFVIEADIG